jgi:hypothetical protein
VLSHEPALQERERGHQQKQAMNKTGERTMWANDADEPLVLLQANIPVTGSYVSELDGGETDAGAGIATY